MLINNFGNTGLTIPVLSFGLGGNSGVENFDRKVSMCMDAGIRLFDTSDAYSGGKSEELLGNTLRGRRPQALLSTKAGLRVGPEINDLGASRYHIINACEASLRRLKTDWIDLYQLHAPDSLTHPAEMTRAMDDLVRSGKVRYIGCSNLSGWQAMQALAVADKLGVQRFTFQQIQYSLVSRDAEFELLPLALNQNLGTMIWGPLASGFLSGKYKREMPRPAGARLERLPDLKVVRDWSCAFDILDAVRVIASERNATVGQVALNWLIRKPWVSTVILGARLISQLSENLGALEWSLSPEEIARLDAVSTPPAIYPYWVHQFSAAERNPQLSGYRP